MLAIMCRKGNLPTLLVGMYHQIDAVTVKNLPARQETWVQSLGWEYPQEKGKATHSTPVFWPGEFHGLHSCKESDVTERFFTSLSFS